jgi:FkbM family methyltransferase
VSLLTFNSTRFKAEQAARTFLFGTPLFFPVRSMYQRLFNREKWQFWNRMSRFYSPLIRSGDVVFDVGANIGVYTELFSRLGATVVAIEPNLECCEKLRVIARMRKIFIENCAAGETVGTAEFHLCEENTMSTLNEQWAEVVSKSELHSQTKWLNKVQVPVKTLDVLANQYGKPSFIKIDAEGYDDHVLAGMSFQPAALSFEFNVNGRDVALNCLKTPALSEGFVFNYTIGHNFRYQLGEWVSATELAELLRTFDGSEEYGEVFARRAKMNH